LAANASPHRRTDSKIAMRSSFITRHLSFVKRHTTRQKLIVLGLTLLAFFLRAYRLDGQSYWIDEAWTVYFANLPLAQLWHLLQTTEIMPPLYHPSTIYWVQLFGDSEYALRFYSLVFGVMAAPFTYRLGKDLGDDRLGLIAALLVTVAPYQIWHSQEARMYSILSAASAMSMWGFVNLWQRGGWRWWLVYLIGTEWAIMVHYHGTVLIGVQGLFLLLTWRRHWRGYLPWAATLGVMFSLYLLWLAFGLNLLQTYINWVPQTTLWESYVRSAIAYSLNESVPREQAMLPVLLFVVSFGLGLLYAASRRWGPWRGPETLALLLAYTLAPNLAAWLYGELKTPVYLERYMIVVQTGYLLTVAMGVLALVDGLPRLLHRHRQADRSMKFAARLAGVLLLLALVSINGWVLYHHYFDPRYAKADWRAVAQTIETFGLPGDAVLLTGDGGENAFDFYYHGSLPVYASFNLYPPTHPDYKKGRPGVDHPEEIMADLAASHRRLWYTPYGVEIDAKLEDWLAQHSYPAWHGWLGSKRLALYRTQSDPTHTEIVNALFADASGHGPYLLRADLPDSPIAAGDVLPLTLTWQTETMLSADYQLSLRLTNTRGDIFAQSDWPPLTASRGTSTWPPNQPLPDRRGMWLSADIPPGDYRLQLVVYNPASGQPLGQPFSLGPVNVAPADLLVPPEKLAISNLSPTPYLKTESLHLLGYVLPAELQPGQEMWLWLYWQAQTVPPAGMTLHLGLHSGPESTFADFNLAEAVGPLDSWQPGQVRRMVYHLPSSPRLAGPQASLEVGLTPPGEHIALADIRLHTRPRQFEPPAIAHPLEVSLGQPPLLKLSGYDAGFPADNALPITLYWQAQAEMSANYTVFVQLLNSAGQVVAQVDRQPQEGAAPTTSWLPGEFLTDSYNLSLPLNLPPGPYRLITGLFDAATGQRLPVASGGDFVELPQVIVE
jgi:4-amino-4-deoxy-L-arabinose transferase-like glycosyltransferase